MDLDTLPTFKLPLPPPGGGDLQSPSLANPSDTDTLPITSPDYEILFARWRSGFSIVAKALYFDLTTHRNYPETLGDSLILLGLCAHDLRHWCDARPAGHQDGESVVLAIQHRELLRYLFEWSARTFPARDETAVERLALRIWMWAHETMPVVQDPESTKKNVPDQPMPIPSPTGQNSTPTASAAETSASGTTSSTICPSDPSTPPSTHGAASAASSA